MAGNDGIAALQAQALAEETRRKKNAAAWTREQENILKVWAEKAAGNRWLHDNAARHYRRQNNRLSYPTIILSTLAGVGGFGGTSLWYVPYIIGFMNINIAIIGSFQKFLRCAEKSELHGNISRQYASFYRNITLELSLDPADRTPPLEMCKNCRAEYDRLSNIAPEVPMKVIDRFKDAFPDLKTKPDVANGMSFIKIYTKKDATRTNDAFIKLKRFYTWKLANANSKSSFGSLDLPPDLANMSTADTTSAASRRSGVVESNTTETTESDSYV
jgi:hypothetical protein